MCACSSVKSITTQFLRADIRCHVTAELGGVVCTPVQWCTHAQGLLDRAPCLVKRIPHGLVALLHINGG